MGYSVKQSWEAECSFHLLLPRVKSQLVTGRVPGSVAVTPMSQHSMQGFEVTV